jgi:hypothetical protein
MTNRKLKYPEVLKARCRSPPADSDRGTWVVALDVVADPDGPLRFNPAVLV